MQEEAEAAAGLRDGDRDRRPETEIDTDSDTTPTPGTSLSGVRRQKRSMRFQALEVNSRESFQVLDVAIELATTLRQPADVLRRRDAGLYRQLREATSSIGLNIGESRGRSGRDRLHHLRIAAGSAEEVRTALRLAAAWGDLRQDAIEPALGLVDRIVMLWRLTH